MSDQPRPDCLSVYHESPDGGGSARTPATASDAQQADVDDDGPLRPPSRFALCAALHDSPACTEDGEAEGGDTPGEEDDEATALPLVETLTGKEIDLLDLEEIVMWGLEGDTGTFVFGRNPYTGRLVSGTFGSAERARAFFSRWGLLRLVYA